MINLLKDQCNLIGSLLDEKVVVTCNRHDTYFDFCSGSLTICCDTINVFDKSKTELTIDHFNEIRQGRGRANGAECEICL